mgnify:FL=1
MIQIETTSHDPFFNQAFEDYVFRTFREDEVLLLWRNRPAVVVGCYQNICREVHVRALLEQNIPVVRRMSGGGTVYHDLGNLNYTLITGQSGALDYDRCLAPVLRALNALGVPAQKSRTCDMWCCYDRNTLTLPRRLYGNTNRRSVLPSYYSFSVA